MAYLVALWAGPWAGLVVGFNLLKCLGNACTLVVYFITLYFCDREIELNDGGTEMIG